MQNSHFQKEHFKRGAFDLYFIIIHIGKINLSYLFQEKKRKFSKKGKTKDGAASGQATRNFSFSWHAVVEQKRNRKDDQITKRATNVIMLVN